MLGIKEYVRVQSLEEAYTLVQDRQNIIIGGMLWLKMQNRQVDKAIDLCDLGLNKIEETDTEFSIGAMVTLRQLEIHKSLNEYTSKAIYQGVHPIVGVQFRNVATLGGSLFGRYGFSDVLTVFMGLDAYVELYHGGIIPILEFAKMSMTKDILVRVMIKKSPLKISYQSLRHTKTDFPVVTCAMSYVNDAYRCVIGARPAKAQCIQDDKHLLENLNEENIKSFAIDVVSQLKFGSNLRGSKEYRERIARVLIKRALNELKEEV